MPVVLRAAASVRGDRFRASTRASRLSPAGAPRSVVEANAGGQTRDARQEAIFEAFDGSSQVVFWVENAFAGANEKIRSPGEA